jgi:hypothetical protein
MSLPGALRVALLTLFGFAWACGAGHGASPSSSNGPQADACGHYYDVVWGESCGSLPLPAAELARQRSRFVQACVNQFSLPGSVATPADVSSCTDSLGSLGCRSNSLPAACLPVGTLATGAACNESLQCASEFCSGAQTTGCGTCSAIIPDGQSCALGTSGTCRPQSQCSSTTMTCGPTTIGDVGAPCGSDFDCKVGLFCGGTCKGLEAKGDSCTSLTDCAYPLICPPATLTCQSPGPPGSACQFDTDCVYGLGCDSSSFTCKAIAWAGAGQACGGATRCFVGDCPAAGGTCPTVIADGQACAASDPASVCDAFSVCLNGMCVLPDSSVCK